MDTPYSMVRLPEVASTQDEARYLFEDTAILVVADRQTVGRGRSGAAWQHAPRAVAASLAWRSSAALPSVIPLLAGLAAARVVNVELKWPNDLVLPSGKVGGVLSEASGGVTVVGLGLNLWWPTPAQGAAALLEEDPGPGAAEAVAGDWAAELLQLVSAPTWPRDEYRTRCSTLGRSITWQPAGAGRAVDIGDDGSLEVMTASGRTSLFSGAVRHVRDLS